MAGDALAAFFQADWDLLELKINGARAQMDTSGIVAFFLGRTWKCHWLGSRRTRISKRRWESWLVQ